MIELPKLQKGTISEIAGLEYEAVPDGNTLTGSHDNVTASSSFKARALKSLLVTSCVVGASFLALSANKAPSINHNEEKMTTASATPMKVSMGAIDDHVDLKTLQSKQFHQSGFGSLNFHQGDDGWQKFRRFLSQSDVTIPKSAVPKAIDSLSEKNIINLHGHYAHDEHRSPFSCPLYDRPEEELKAEQEEYIKKMHDVRVKWGEWSFKDHSNVVRPVQDFSNVEYKDLEKDAWGENVWQKDEQYTKDLIKEGRSLVGRMTEAIYEELGHPATKADGTALSEEEMKEREDILGPRIFNDGSDDGFDFMNLKKVKEVSTSMIDKNAFDALARKLLHAMITNDEFYFVLGGHSAAAGHGNNMQQQKTMVSYSLCY